MKTRPDALQSISGKAFDICVIGGGATGAGCALEAQLRGLKTVLLDASDFAGATSSSSTKLIHGGIRYLEQAVRKFDIAEYQVVKLGLRERGRMLRNAPFLTHTVEFLVPCFGWLDSAYFRVGLKLYDWIAGDEGLSASHIISREEVIRRMPGFSSRKLTGAVCYADGQFDDSRYNIALIHSFIETGGEALNYARVIAFDCDAKGRISRAQVEDQISKHRFELNARAFVNAAGPFADELRRMANSDLNPRLRVSKGAHILFEHASLPISSPIVIPKTADGRVLFAVPWQGRVLIGTTDEEITTGHPVEVTRADVDYLLREINSLLEVQLRAGQIVSGFAGVRPLVLANGSKNTKELARDHVVEMDERSGMISIMGGKWTTYRAMAEDAINAVEKSLGRKPTTSATRDFRLSGSNGYSPEYWLMLKRDYSISDEMARHLSAKYGTAAPDILELAKADPEFALPLIRETPVLRAEVIFAARCEMATTIEDVLARRTGLQFYSWRLAIKATPGAAALMARELGWSPEFTRFSTDLYVQKIVRMIQQAGLDKPQAANG